MATKNPPTPRTIPLLLAAFLISIPAPAQYGGGRGTPEDPYQIAAAADLIVLGETHEDYDKHFILTADIDLDPNLPGRQVFSAALIGGRIVEAWPPTGRRVDDQGVPFTGVLDGNDYEIRNLAIDAPWSMAPLTGEYVGLIAQIGKSGRVERLGLRNVSIDGEYGVVTASFWDVQTSGCSEASGGTGKTTAEMQTAGTFLDVGWDFVGETANGTEDIWRIDEGKDYPRLWWEAPTIDDR